MKIAENPGVKVGDTGIKATLLTSWRRRYPDLTYVERHLRSSPSYRAQFIAHMTMPSAALKLSEMIGSETDRPRLLQAVRQLREIAAAGSAGERHFLPAEREVTKDEAGGMAAYLGAEDPKDDETIPDPGSEPYEWPESEAGGVIEDLLRNGS